VPPHGDKQMKHKFGAIRCLVDEIKFSSKLEAQFYNQLKLRQLAGDVIFFLMQCPFRLPGKIKYVVDFIVFLSNGDIEFIDVKGMRTPISTLKIKQVEEIYPIKIKIVEKI